ncbi:unnamed protein product [Urochloa decumbens]|uniref:Cullin N-terminal domain-containing protein n=1 Tax=Urochloa decumbens TaxID=240449 RepID=A0ABC9GCB9_9POAL
MAKMIELEEGWQFLAAGMAKMRLAVEADGEEARIPANDYLELYATVYNMCTQKAPHDYSRQLYERFKEDVDSYNKSTVLPPLKEVQGEILLRDLVERWRKHKKIGNLQGFFRYLGRYYIPGNYLPTIQQVAYTSFRELVFNEIRTSVTGAVISMVNDDREGKLVDRELLKNVLDIYVQIGLDTYQADFERTFCESTRNYYSTKAQTWILEYSHPDYMLKVEDCLKKEMERAEHYLHSSTGPKIMEVVRSELMAKNAESHTNV